MMDRSKEVVSLPELRKDMAFVFLCSGTFHLLLMLSAILYAYGRLPFEATPVAWTMWYLLHLVVTFLSGALCVFFHRKQSPFYLAQLAVDAAVGIVVFQVLFSISKWVIAARWVDPWLSLVPGAFLVCYGLRLRTGRQVWSRLNLQ
ncbi:MAG: hypothetical protein HY748_04745 [Elusimicrobia bacterium]|nr:hypothetical protein [Elusimicrobiota bacterium]